MTLEVAVSGSSPVSYQWFADGVEIPNETQRRLDFTANVGRSGQRFTVRVSNSENEVTSEAAILSVSPSTAPVILSDSYAWGFVLDDASAFWTDGTGVFAAPLDCSSAPRPLWQGGPGDGNTDAIDVSVDQVFWSDSSLGRVMTTSKEGTDWRQIASNLPHPILALSVDQYEVYWLDVMTGIKVVGLGGGPYSDLVRGTFNADALVRDESYLYWYDLTEGGASIYQAARSDGAVSTLATGVPYTSSIVVSGSDILIASSDTTLGVGRVLRLPVGGGTIETLIEQAGRLGKVAVDRSSVYWTSRAANGEGAIWRAPLGSWVPEVLVGDVAYPHFVGATNDFVVWTDRDGIKRIRR